MRALARALIFFACGVCGDNLAGTGEPRSGSRLKIGWHVYEDGTRQRETTWYHDAARDERCAPRTWSDGHRYCAPAAGEAVYTSSACDEAVARVPAGTVPPTYAIAPFYLRGQPLPSRLFRVGARTGEPGGVWQRHQAGCTGPMPVAAGFDYHAIAKEVPITELVAIRHGAPRGDGALQVLDDTSDDGLHVPAAVFDRDAVTECMLEARANAATVDCAPGDSALISYAADAACSEPKLAVTGPVPATARQYSDVTSCWTYYDIGMQTSPLPLYEDVGGHCLAVSPPDGPRYFLTAGKRTLPALDRVREVSERRLLRIERVHGDVRIDDPLLFDSELAADCRRDALGRCVPDTDARVLPYFSDDTCGEPIDLAFVPSGACDPPARYARSGDAIHPLLARYEAPIYELSTGDRCGLYVAPVPLEPWSIGPAQPASSFLTSELTIDP